MQTAGWWQLKGLFIFTPEPWGRSEDSQFDEYFSNGLVQPPTSSALVCFQLGEILCHSDMTDDDFQVFG